jgi:hypothetical protein
LTPPPPVRQMSSKRQGANVAHQGIKPAFVCGVALLSFIEDVD